MIIHFEQKILGSAESFLISAYEFVQHHMIEVTVCLRDFNIIIIVNIRKLLYNNYLYAGNL